jgi:hypothetical protein
LQKAVTTFDVIVPSTIHPSGGGSLTTDDNNNGGNDEWWLRGMIWGCETSNLAEKDTRVKQ